MLLSLFFLNYLLIISINWQFKLYIYIYKIGLQQSGHLVTQYSKVVPDPSVWLLVVISLGTNSNNIICVSNVDSTINRLLLSLLNLWWVYWLSLHVPQEWYQYEFRQSCRSERDCESMSLTGFSPIGCLGLNLANLQVGTVLPIQSEECYCWLISGSRCSWLTARC